LIIKKSATRIIIIKITIPATFVFFSAIFFHLLSLQFLIQILFFVKY